MVVIIKRSKTTGKPYVVHNGEPSRQEAINQSLEVTVENVTVSRPQRRTHTWHSYNVVTSGDRDNERLRSYSAKPEVYGDAPTFMQEPLDDEHEPVFDYHSALEFTGAILKNYTVDNSTVLFGAIKDVGTDGSGLIYVGKDSRTGLRARPGVSLPGGFESKQFQEDIAAVKGDTDRLDIYH